MFHKCLWSMYPFDCISQIVLQLPLHLFILNMNEYQWSSSGLKTKRVGLIIHGWLLMDKQFIPNDLPKHSCTITINICLMNLGIYTILCFLYIFNVSEIDDLITDRKIVHFFIQSNVSFHGLSCINIIFSLCRYYSII